MIKEITITLGAPNGFAKEKYAATAAKKLGVSPNDIRACQIVRRSIDARRGRVKVTISLRVALGENLPDVHNPEQFHFDSVHNKQSVCIVGAGPAGLFAALRCIQLGLKPVIIERGKNVTDRKRDIALLNRGGVVNPDSNYCFGEGGAGAFSDGKLYTRSKKRGDNSNVLQLLQYHGADPSVLYETHPHIGTDRLPEVLKSIRGTICDAGGEFLFNTTVESILIQNDRVCAVETSSGERIDTVAVILAVGQSARGIYKMLNKKGLALEPKNFAVGVRIEHPQELIDHIQYHCKKRWPGFPAASYNLVTQVQGRGVYSFCMCPGGFIVPCETETDEIVVNGMSPARRNSPYANSGIVVEIRQEDLLDYTDAGVFAGMVFQKKMEQNAFTNRGNSTHGAPAQRLTDFLQNRISQDMPDSSYLPGIVSSPLHDWLPALVRKSLQRGFESFGKKMKGYISSEAIVVGVETRTSPPLRIPRSRTTLQHPQCAGLYPCGEGAGYAGGIVSSAIDGMRCMEQAAEYVKMMYPSPKGSL